MIGRYGKKLAEHELVLAVNTKYKEEMIQRLGGKEAPVEDKVGAVEKLVPQAMVERKTVFRNSLIQLVKFHHKNFCSQLKPPIVVDDRSMVRFHKDFNVDSCPPVEEAELPAKPEVELVTTAAQILEKSRALFEINPKLSESLASAAEKKKVPEVTASSPAPAPAPAVRKDLQGLPQKLIDKILAKEAEKAAKDMLTDKSKEDKVRRLRRLPEIARLVKSVFISERKTALLTPIVLKKVVDSYPGQMSTDNMTKDLKYLVEVTSGFISFVSVQGKEYLKLNSAADINKVVGELDKLFEKAKN